MYHRNAKSSTRYRSSLENLKTLSHCSEGYIIVMVWTFICVPAKFILTPQVRRRGIWEVIGIRADRALRNGTRTLQKRPQRVLTSSTTSGHSEKSPTTHQEEEGLTRTQPCWLALLLDLPLLELWERNFYCFSAGLWDFIIAAPMD